MLLYKLCEPMKSNFSTKVILMTDETKEGAASLLPVYALIGVALIVAIGFGLFNWMQLNSISGSMNTSTISGLESRIATLEQKITEGVGGTTVKPKASLVYDSKCTVCGDMLTFSTRLGTQYGLDMTMLDISSADASQKQQATGLVLGYNITALPAMVVTSDEATKSSFLQGITARTEFTKVKSGAFVINVFTAQGATGSELLGAECGSPQNVQITVFNDPYCPSCLANKDDINTLRTQFAGESTFELKMLPAQSTYTTFGKANVTNAVNYLTCAAAQNKLEDFEQCFYQTHNSTGVALSQTELDECVNNWKLNTTQLSACIPTVNATIEANMQKAAEWGILGTPYVVANCKYVTYVSGAKTAVCLANPALRGCA